MGSSNLKGTVAVVTGASRGGGRGVALELGAAGATVYVTGRRVRGQPGGGYGRFLERLGLEAAPGSVEETAEEVSRLGGQGIPVRCDHTDEAQVAALFERVDREQGRLDLLVNNAWGGHQNHVEALPFWEQPTAHWEGMFQAGLRNHFLASRYAAPLLVRQRRGLIVTTAWDRERYLHTLYYDVAHAAINRLAFGMAQELRRYGVPRWPWRPGG